MEIIANIWKGKIIVISCDDLNEKREQKVLPSGHALHNPVIVTRLNYGHTLSRKNAKMF